MLDDEERRRRIYLCWALAAIAFLVLVIASQRSDSKPVAAHALSQIQARL